MTPVDAIYNAAMWEKYIEQIIVTGKQDKGMGRPKEKDGTIEPPA